jgi:hypothetical protein
LSDACKYLYECSRFDTDYELKAIFPTRLQQASITQVHTKVPIIMQHQYDAIYVNSCKTDIQKHIKLQIQQCLPIIGHTSNQLTLKGRHMHSANQCGSLQL